MTGIVLCGGNSTRMGRDKGLLKEEEETWAEFAVRKLQALDLPVFVSVNPQQVPIYEQIFSAKQLLVDNERFSEKAPLFGLLSAHLQLPDEDLFILACDIKDMTMDLLKNLLDAAKQESNEAYVYHTGDRPQPLCGIYSAAGLQHICKLFEEGNLQRFSMMHTLEILQTKFFPVNEENRPAFNNYNSPEEI